MTSPGHNELTFVGVGDAQGIFTEQNYATPSTEFWAYIHMKLGDVITVKHLTLGTP